MSILDTEWSKATKVELLLLLNVLLEAERAGAQVLRVYLDDYAPDSPASSRLRAVQHDEATNCSVIVDLIRELDGCPSLKTGDFLAKAVAVQGKGERLEFLNRGQGWVVRKIQQALPLAPGGRIRDALQEMLDSHVRNIKDCEQLIHEV